LHYKLLIFIVIGYYNMTAISASRRKTINRVLEVSALAVQAYAILELNELEAGNTGNKANAGTRRRQAKKFWVRQWLLRRPFVRAIRETDGRNEGGRPRGNQRCKHGTNTVSAAAPWCQHGVKSTAEVGGKN